MTNQIIPLDKVIHPVTAIALDYLNNNISMKTLDEWKSFFQSRSEKNNLAKKLFATTNLLLCGEQIPELDFIALMWMLLQFSRTKEEEANKIKLNKEIVKLKKELYSNKDG